MMKIGQAIYSQPAEATKDEEKKNDDGSVDAEVEEK